MTNMSVAKAFALNFMGTAPVWYKLFIVACLIINPIVAIFISPMLAGWRASVLRSCRRRRRPAPAPQS